MRFLNSLQLAKSSTPSPALSRGIAVLVELAEHAPRSLEQLATQLQLPKASVFRLLDTLEKIGAIRRNPDKTYEPLWAIESLVAPQTQLRNQMIRRMPALCSETGCTVEWYEPVSEGMQLILQELPQTELRVEAKPGYLRDWTTEFDAVARLGNAFAHDAPTAITATSRYVTNGEMKTLSQKEIRTLIEQARTARSAHDSAFNANGVRRFAAAALDPREHLVGVLAIAEGYHFSERTKAETYLAQLKETLNR